ncbi:MAG: DUF2851 family protein [Rubricoccaceae bacterium]
MRTRPDASPFFREPDAPVARVPEAVLQDAWAQRLYRPGNLHTHDGLPLLVLDPGTLNLEAGPDFSAARIRIGEGPDALEWAGDVEVHRTSGDWIAHRHHDDPAYNRVVLHVVLGPDQHTGTLRRADGTPLPELVLLPHLDRSLRRLIHAFYATPRPTPMCAPRWPDVPVEIQRAWVEALGVERLRVRAERLARRYAQRPDPEALLLAGLFRGLGYRANADAMERLARRFPLALARRLGAARDVLALVTGLSGLHASGLFPDDLTDRFARLREAHALTPLPPGAWHPGGRPANAPARRLEQAAALFYPADGDAPPGLLRHDPLGRLHAALHAERPVAALRRLLQPPGRPAPGRARVDVLLAGAVLPSLLLEAEQREDAHAERAIVATLAALPPEADTVTARFAAAGYAARSLLDTQGLHQLAQHFCDEGRCARCAIGRTLYPIFTRRVSGA